MIMLCVALQLCACGGGHKETDDVADTSKEVGYEFVALVPDTVAPDTVVGRFIEPNRVDTLLFRKYSEKKIVRMVELSPYQVANIRRHIKDDEIVVMTTYGRILHSEFNRWGVYRAVALDGLVPGTDALAIVWNSMQDSNNEMCHVVTMANGQWREIGSFDVNIFCFPDSTHAEHGIEGVLEKRKGEWMYRSYEDQMQWYEDHDSGDCPMKLLKSILHVMP